MAAILSLLRTAAVASGRQLSDGRHAAVGIEHSF